MNDIDKPVPYALTDAGMRFLEEQDEAAEAVAAALDNPDAAPCGIEHPPTVYCTVCEFNKTLAASRECGQPILGPTPPSRVDGPADQREALGRITGCASKKERGSDRSMPSGGKDRSPDEGGPRAGKNQPARLSSYERFGGQAADAIDRERAAPIQGAPAIETSTRPDDEEPDDMPDCMRCLQLRLELEQARKDFRTLARPFLAQFPTMSYQQVELYQAKLAPIAERVKVAKRSYERHVEKCRRAK